MKTCVFQVNVDCDAPLITFCMSEVEKWAYSNNYDYKVINNLSAWALNFPLPSSLYKKCVQKYETLSHLINHYDTLIHLDSDILPIFNPSIPHVKFGVFEYERSLHPEIFKSYKDAGIIYCSDKNLADNLFSFFDKYDGSCLPSNTIKEEYLFNCWVKHQSQHVSTLPHKKCYKPRFCGIHRNTVNYYPPLNSFIHFTGKTKEKGYYHFVQWLKHVDNTFGCHNFDHFPDAFDEPQVERERW